MDQSKINMFISSMQDRLPRESMLLIVQQLKELDDEKFALLHSVNYRNPTNVLIVSIFLGGLGIDRFLLDQPGLGVLKLLTCGGFGIWALIDWFLIMDLTKQYNYKKLNRIVFQME
jgi:TM2 domain-containing membrane protein YozV